MAKNLINKVKLILPFIGLIILVYIFYSLDIHKIITAFLSIEPIFIIYALLLTIPLLLIRNAIWQIILKEQKITVGFFVSLKIYLIGVFYGSISPGYYGQLMRVPYLKEKTSEPFGKLFINTIIETFIHSFSLYGMMIIGALMVIGTLPELLPITVIWILCFALLAVYFTKKDRGEKFFRIIISYLIPKKIKPHLNAFVDTFYIDFPRFKTMIIPYVLGAVTWIIVFSQEYMILIGIGTSDSVFCVSRTISNSKYRWIHPNYICGIRDKGVNRYFYFYDAFPCRERTDSGVVPCRFYSH